MYFLCSMIKSFILPNRTIFTFLLFQHILEIDHGREYSVILRRWVRRIVLKAHLVIECVDESIDRKDAAKDGAWGQLSTGDLSLYWTKVHSLYCLANSFFFTTNLFNHLVKNVPGILPLPRNLRIFISSWMGRIH